MRDSESIKPQDLLILMKLLVSSKLTQSELASSLSISSGEISYGIRRLRNANLVGAKGEPKKTLAFEFFVHALKFICPPKLGGPTLGLPTAHAHPDINIVKYSDYEKYVWPFGGGNERGIALLPIYSTVPDACAKDENLYKLASLVEMIRAGRAREINYATEELKLMLVGHSE